MTTDLIVQSAAPATTIIVKAELLAQVASLHDDMGAAPAITDQASLDAVRKIMVAAKTLMNTVEGQKTAAQSPYKKVTEAIATAAKSVTDRLEEVVDSAKMQIEDFLRERDRQILEQERQRVAAEAAAHATHAALGGARPTAPLVLMPQSQAVVAPVTKGWELQITNTSMIPDEFWVVDMVALRRAVVTEQRIVPGALRVQSSRVDAR